MTEREKAEMKKAGAEIQDFLNLSGDERQFYEDGFSAACRWKDQENQEEVGGDGVIAPENNHPAFRDYLYHIKPRDRTLSDAFNAGLKARPPDPTEEESDD